MSKFHDQRLVLFWYSGQWWGTSLYALLQHFTKSDGLCMQEQRWVCYLVLMLWHCPNLASSLNASHKILVSAWKLSFHSWSRRETFFQLFLKERRVNMADWDASSVNSPAGTTSSIFSGKLLVTIRWPWSWMLPFLASNSDIISRQLRTTGEKRVGSKRERGCSQGLLVSYSRVVLLLLFNHHFPLWNQG